MREIYVYLDLVTPCKFWDDSYFTFEEYVNEQLNDINIPDAEYEGISFKVSELNCDAGVTATLQISGLQGGFRESDDEFGEDAFITEYTPVLKGYIDNTLIPQLNAALRNDIILGSLPNAYIVFSSERVFVQIDYSLTAIEFDCYPAEVEFNGSVEDIISDLYFTEEG